MLRASSDDVVAAHASAIPVLRLRLLALILSAFVVGSGGAIYAHFVGILSPDNFYLGMTFITLAMVVIGGIGSLSGAVVGMIIVTIVVQTLRLFEAGVTLGATEIKLPNGSQEVGLAIAWILFLVPACRSKFCRQGASRTCRASPPSTAISSERLSGAL